MNFKLLSKLTKVTKFQPSGEDVISCQALLVLQSLDFVGKLFYTTYHGIFVVILQAIFTLPLLALSIYLFTKFKYAFNISCMRNIIIISSLMIIENGMNLILRFMVGLKSFLSQEEEKSFALLNFTLPIVFVTCWMYVRQEAEIKDGHYGAPISLMKKFEYDEAHLCELDQTN